VHDWNLSAFALTGYGAMKSEADFKMVKSAKIELCVTKLRLSGLGVGFFDRNI
jgi:hypothetical protein